MKNIIIVIPSLTLGGAEKQAYQYAITIAGKEGYSPLVLGLGKQGELVSVLEKNKIAHASFPIHKFAEGNRIQKIIFLIQFAFFIRTLKPHKIISFTYWPNVLTGVVWRFAGVKMLYWNQRSVDSSIPISLWEKFAIKFKPQYIANSKACASFISQRHHVEISSVNIIYNTLDVPVLNATSKNNSSLIVVMLANFFSEKDHSTVLKAFSKYINDKQNPKAELHFIGSAPGVSSQMAECKAEAFDLGLCGNVFFHGTLSRPEVLLKTADMAVLSTRSEGFSNAIMEYMVYGLPVIATDIPPNREVLGDENEDFLFPIGDIDKLKTLLINFAKNKELRERVGNKNRMIAIEKFNSVVYGKSLLQLLQINN